MGGVLILCTSNTNKTAIANSLRPVIESMSDRYVYEQGEIRGEIGADTFVYAIGYQANQDLYHELEMDEQEIYLLGDARRPKNIMYAIWDAYELGNNL